MAKRKPKWRSGCPLNASLEMLGDRWSLLIIRDMMLLGSQRFKEFLGSHERIATNILADRLRKLGAYGIIRTESDRSDGRKLIYRIRRSRRRPRMPAGCKNPTSGQVLWLALFSVFGFFEKFAEFCNRRHVR